MMKKSKSIKSIELVFTEEGDEFTVTELVNYLTYLRSIYAYVQKKPELIVDDTEINRLNNLANFKSYEDKFINSGFSENSSKRYYKKDLGEKDVFISTITKQSPLAIALVGLGGALITAIILSGGKLDLKAFGVRLKFKLNSLGDGISKIQDVIDRSEQIKQNKKIIDKYDLFEEKINLLPEDPLAVEIAILERARKVKGIDDKTERQLKEEIKRLRKKRKNR